MRNIASVLIVISCANVRFTSEPLGAAHNFFSRDDLVAWRVEPFDAKKDGPEERAAMADQLGLKQLAGGWRGEHVPALEMEIETAKKHGIEFSAFWAKHEETFKLFEKHSPKPQPRSWRPPPPK